MDATPQNSTPGSTFPGEAATLPPPRRAGAALRLAALLLLGLGCLIAAFQLRSSAAYALVDGGPRDLRDLQSARLGVPSHGAWVRGQGELEHDAVSFERRGNSGSLLLGRVARRSDLWVLLPVPKNTPHYFPPRILEGRLLSREAMGLRLRPVVALMDLRGARPTDHLLIVGSLPAEHRTDLVLMLLLTALGFMATIRFTLLALPARTTVQKR